MACWKKEILSTHVRFMEKITYQGLHNTSEVQNSEVMWYIGDINKKTKQDTTNAVENSTKIYEVESKHLRAKLKNEVKGKSKSRKALKEKIIRNLEFRSSH